MPKVDMRPAPRKVRLNTPDEVVDYYQSKEKVVNRYEMIVLTYQLTTLEADARAGERLQIAISDYSFEADLVPESSPCGRILDANVGHAYLLWLPITTDANSIILALESDGAQNLYALRMNVMALNTLTRRGHSMEEPAVRRTLKAIDEAARDFLFILAKPT